MWRSNYHEDWERRKTYLIRCLFQDIPVLSPVPEEESRYGGNISPSDIPASRPHSPLPPLIIERMPNRHDHPKKYYNDLEKKMKKLYKKLFLNKESSSVEDLIKTYGVASTTPSFIDELKDCCGEVDAKNASVSTVTLGDNRSQCYSISVPESLSQKPSDINVSKCLSDSSNLSSEDGSSISKGSRGIDVQSSTLSLFQTQVTTVVEIHQEQSSVRDETLLSSHHGIHISPERECHLIEYSDTVSTMDMYQEERNEKQPNDSNNETAGSKTLVSTNKEDSKEVDLDQISSSEVSHKSVEIMRRQREISLSLGSLQNELFATSSLKSTSTNIELHKNMLLDISQGNNSSEMDVRHNVSFSSVTVDFSNALSTSTPNLIDRYTTRSSIKSNETGKRGRTEPPDGDDKDDSVMIIKKRKCKNIATQTSLISESDAEEIVDWSRLEKNFFVGVPRIYKLCQ